MTGSLAVLRNEVRLLRHDPVPPAILVAMPIVLMALLSRSMDLPLAYEGFNAPGSTQTVPGMACVFAFFGVGILGFGVFREHGWRTWTRLRLSGLSGPSLILGKLLLPTLLLAGQHVILFAVGYQFLDLRANGSWVAAALVATCFSAVVLAAGLAATALLSTVQQLNAVTNLGAMIAGGLGGGFVPVSLLPDWVQPLAPGSPVKWAMDGYRTAFLEYDVGVRDVVNPCLVLLAFAAGFALVATLALRRNIDAPKRTWG
ncbi:hypothetical protein DSM112329_05069 [Paraconexibacter sp. AEG42_29]|uniref:ABC-2 type transporter transmembrane domain-containing protein n=1 Tax=Paraconexibacter sp. AEG42_29 TaxID=2997339 RepID=A0AAU7B2C5_9ACTN